MSKPNKVRKNNATGIGPTFAIIYIKLIGATPREGGETPHE